MKDKQWKWKEPEEKKESLTWKVVDSIDNETNKGTRSLSDVYKRSNIVVCEPAEFEETVKNDEWIKAMK
jgi:hypothetical protein